MPSRFPTGPLAPVLASLLLVVPVTGTVAAEPGDGQILAPEGRFRVWVPAEPAVTESETRTFLGSVRDATYVVELEEASLAVEHHDVPAIATALMSDDAILERTARSVVDDVEGRLLSERSDTVGGRPCRVLSYLVEGPPTLLEEARLILDGTRVYVLTATRPRAASAPAFVRRFFDSFELLEPTDF